MKDKLVKLLKDKDIIVYKDVFLKNAGHSNFYINIKKAYGYPKILKLISRCLSEKIDENTTCVAAAGYGGLPIASLISYLNNLNLSLIREDSKSHGLSNQIEGYIPNKDDSIAIIDDVYTTGNSLKRIIEILEPTKAYINGCYVVVKREEKPFPIRLEYLLEKKDLL